LRDEMELIGADLPDAKPVAQVPDITEAERNDLSRWSGRG
jgi:hypothetical protein